MKKRICVHTSKTVLSCHASAKAAGAAARAATRRGLKVRLTNDLNFEMKKGARMEPLRKKWARDWARKSRQSNWTD